MSAFFRVLGYTGVGLLALAGGLATWLWLSTPQPEPRTEWTLGPEMPMAFGELASVAVPREEEGEWLVVLSGITGLGQVVDDVFLYDAQTGSWSPGPALPAPRHHSAAAELAGAVVVAGGAESLSGDPWEGSSTVWRWQPGDDQGWESLPPMPETRWGHRLVSHDGRLYVVGGTGETGDTLIYHPESESWSRAAAIPESRHHLSAVLVNDRIWAIGGRSPQSLTRVDIYDPAEDSWSSGPDLPLATSGAAEGVVDGQVHIFGGEEADLWTGGIVRQHWVLDTDSEAPRWRPAPPPPLAVHGSDGAVFQGRMVIVGGASRHGLSSVLGWTPVFQRLDPPGPDAG